jgi:hypothetical protein
MVEEGCVLAAATEPIGAVVDVAPDGFPHAVYRSGLALPVRLPVIQEEIELEEIKLEQINLEEPVPAPAPEPELYYEI